MSRTESESGTDGVAEVTEPEDFEFDQQFGARLRASLKILWDDWRSRIGVLLLLGYLLMGTVGVLVIPEPVFGQTSNLLGLWEDPRHILGSDSQGRGLLSLTVHATPTMLKMVAAGGVFASMVGAFVGTVSGYKGGRIDRILMTITDMMMTIPGLPLVIIIAAAVEPRNPYAVGILLAINNWSGLARGIRSQVLTVREESYVESSRALGMSTLEIVRRDVIPPLMPYVSVNFMNSSRRIIFESVGLYFLGVLPYSNQNWGIMLNDAFSNGALYKLSYVHWLLVPLFTIVLFSLSLVLVSQGADKIFNPRIQVRYRESDGETGETDSMEPTRVN